MAWDIGPVLFEYGATVGFELNELDGSHSGSLEPEAKPSKAAEEVEDTHYHLILSSVTKTEIVRAQPSRWAALRSDRVNPLGCVRPSTASWQS
jgi:hypothetical protein